jgi:hypothetical protein
MSDFCCRCKTVTEVKLCGFLPLCKKCMPAIAPKLCDVEEKEHDWHGHCREGSQMWVCYNCSAVLQHQQISEAVVYAPSNNDGYDC